MDEEYEVAKNTFERNKTNQEDESGQIDGLDHESGLWGDYPLNALFIRQENRTIFEVIRRIDNETYVMDPEFQRDFIWDEDKQSKLIESVLMRIPLPVFYMAENDNGQLVVVDGLQRLTTFHRFLKGELKLRLKDREGLRQKKFDELESIHKNRIEDCNLIFYIIDSKVPERARLDIFERVNGGVALTRQQMRNCLFMGPATRFLKEESRTEIFLDATGKSLNTKTMRDREFVNRFCAFQVLELDAYRGDLDDFLALCLRKMNKMNDSERLQLSTQFRNGLANNLMLFGQHSFRKHTPDQTSRNRLNVSLWDVMSTSLSNYTEEIVRANADALRQTLFELQDDDDFMSAITSGTNATKQVRCRFEMTKLRIQGLLGAKTY